jgi:hypothetical protein
MNLASKDGEDKKPDKVMDLEVQLKDGKDAISNDAANEFKNCKLPKLTVLMKCLLVIGAITIVIVVALGIKGFFTSTTDALAPITGGKYSSPVNSAC